LFAGTGNGLYYSLDDGEHWTALQTGLPAAPVTWTVVQPGFHDLVLSTYGRGLYILDDITPLEQMAKHRSDTPGAAAPGAAAAVVLFEPRPAYRFVRGPQAMLNFSIKALPKGPVEFEIVDSQGSIVRKLESKESKELVVGINRVKWDLRFDSPRVIALRTAAPDNPQIWQEPRFRDADSRPITHWGSKPGEVGPIAAPGTYSVHMKVDGQSFSQPLTVLSDPHSPGSNQDIDLSVKTLLRIRDDISHVSDSVNQMEWLRKQMEIVEKMLKPAKKVAKPEQLIAEEGDEPDSEPAAAPPPVLNDAQERRKKQLLAAAEDLDKKVQTVESRLVSQALQNSDDKYFVEPYGTYLDLIWLNAEVGTGGGDVAGSADFAPSATQLELLNTFEADAAGADSDYRKILQEDLPPFDQALQGANIAPVSGSAP
jgi:hypothetical protein